MILASSPSTTVSTLRTGALGLIGEIRCQGEIWGEIRCQGGKFGGNPGEIRGQSIILAQGEIRCQSIILRGGNPVSVHHSCPKG